MSYYVYILYSKSFDKYYIGSSQDPGRRLESHNTSARSSYTAKYRPWEMAAIFVAGETRAEAEAMEKYLKQQKSKKLLERIIEPTFELSGKLAQLVRVPHVRD